MQHIRPSDLLLDLFSAKGGAAGQRIKNLLKLIQVQFFTSVVKKRDVTLRCLIEYMGESGPELISEYYGKRRAVSMRTLKCDVCRESHAVGIIIAY